MKKKTVAIGIPAYNEEANIAFLLDSIQRQKLDNFVLKEVIIVSESTDNTNNIVRQYKDKRIKLVESRERKGQQFAQNVVIKEFDSDILVFVEGDMRFATKNTLENLLKPFLKHNNPIVAGAPLNSDPKTLLEAIINHGNLIKRNLFLKHNGGMNIYLFGGHAGKAMSRKFAKTIQWPKHVPEDSYFYLFAKQSKMTFYVQQDAKFSMRNVQTVPDRIKQCTKFHSGRKSLEKYFKKEEVRKEYSVPKTLIVSVLCTSFIENPVMTSLYCIEAALNRVLTQHKKTFDALYAPYYSSKQLSKTS